MAQHDYSIANNTGSAVRTDLNNSLAAIVSQNSGSSAPSTTFSYQQWADTSAGLLKIRNGANNAWVTVGTLDQANLGLATLASPNLSGNPTAPTAASGDNDTSIATTAFVKAAVDTAVAAAINTQADINGYAYPVGSIYTSIVSTNPATLLGMGTWVAFGAGRVLAGLDGGDTSMQTAEQTGGAKTDSHTLTTSEIPSHTHTLGYEDNAWPDSSGDVAENVLWNSIRSPDEYRTTSATGGGAAHTHDIVQPYIVVYFWKRTA
jgi:hypothetical protein